MEKSVLYVLFETDDYGWDKLFVRPVGVYETVELAERAALQCFKRRFADQKPPRPFYRMEKSVEEKRIRFNMPLGEDCSYGFHIKNYELNQEINFLDEDLGEVFNGKDFDIGF